MSEPESHKPILASERLPELNPPEGLALSYSDDVEICMGHRYTDGRFGNFEWQDARLASEGEYNQPELHWLLSDYDHDYRVELADVIYWVPKWNRPLPADIESFALPGSPEIQAAYDAEEEAKRQARYAAPPQPGEVRITREHLINDNLFNLPMVFREMPESKGEWTMAPLPKTE